jgi:hypothetical protein
MILVFTCLFATPAFADEVIVESTTGEVIVESTTPEIQARFTGKPRGPSRQPSEKAKEVLSSWADDFLSWLLQLLLR